MPYTASSKTVSFTVTTAPAPPACPEGSECINALRCVEMGRKCIEGTSGCGGVPQNCCCAPPPAPPAPPVPPAPPPEEVRIPALIIVVAGIAVAGIAGLALWRLLRRS